MLLQKERDYFQGEGGETSIEMVYVYLIQENVKFILTKILNRMENYTESEIITWLNIGTKKEFGLKKYNKLLILATWWLQTLI